MNRFIFNVSIFTLSFALFFCALTYRQKPYRSVLRLHILANSDSARDQNVKLKVRNAVLACERERLSGAKDRTEAEQNVMADAAHILRAADAVLRENGCGYGARLCMGVYTFPDRVYAEKEYPAGEYAALRIVLGEGGGHNWWCVLFPPLCIAEGENGEIEYAEDGSVKWKSLLAEWAEKGEKKDEIQSRQSSPAAFDAASAALVRTNGRAGGGDP